MKVSYKLEIKQVGMSPNLDVVWFEGEPPTNEQIEEALDNSLKKLSKNGGVTAKLTTHYYKSNKES